MILITGGMGFIGSHLARELLRRKYDVVILDVSGHEKLIKDVEDEVKIVRGDITVREQVTAAVKKYGVDAIFHYAASLSSAAEADPQTAYKVNFDGLWNIFEAARVIDLKTVIFASSVAAYGSDAPQTVREDTYTLPQTLYGISKQFGEMLGLWFQRKYGVDFAAFRYGSVIGPGRQNGGASAYSTLIIQKSAQMEPYTVNVPEDSRIPLVYVKDAVDATLTAYEKISNLKSRIYNLTSLIPSPKAEDLVQAVKRHIPNAKIKFRPNAKVTEIVRSWPKDFDITRAESEFGWEPKYSSLDSLIIDFVNEVRQHPDIYKV